jgi:hypothetical protein
MEVLISIFVLSIGMLGVAALIPVGRFSIVETSKADRGAACGQAGMHEVKVRQMLEPRLWAFADPSTNPPGAIDASGAAVPLSTFVIDPLFIARNAPAAWTDSVFPYKDTSGVSLPGENMPRITFRSWLAAPLVMSEPVADRIFTWSDDLLFERDEDDESQRPRQQMIWSDGVMAPFPPANLPEVPILRQSEGRYSWLLCVTPAVSEVNMNAAQKRTYTVSVVVFYKRDLSGPPDPSDTLSIPTERAVDITFLSDGYAGGDVKLDAPAREYLNVKPNEWLMITGRQAVPSPTGFRRVGVWYRVVMVDEEPEFEVDHWTRYVTLAGPDWTAAGAAQAVLLDGVVGVYTTTVVLDRESTWTK